MSIDEVMSHTANETPEQIKQREFREWIKDVVKKGHEVAEGKLKDITKLNLSIQMHLLELGHIKRVLDGFGIGWSQLDANITSYSGGMSLSIQLGDETFKDWFLNKQKGLEIDRYASTAQSTIEVTEKIKVTVRAESLTREALMATNKQTPVKSITDDDDLPF